ncbi:YfjI family protein [Streptosporangium sp. NBC_01469]|uniref:YfjI family protein n=1 Tax=Streptosporangium sp. NBC_01469 TaxID=2903898 RepID=UPI002E2E0334|nr:YfjI family protein [Streptosporangium sp. NBC_01469]
MTTPRTVTGATEREFTQVRHVVMMSGGIGSWATARRVIAQHGAASTVLLFADTLVEDPDLYRFLDEAAAQLGARLVRVADGRTPWQVFQDVRFIGNSRVAPCSKYLKQVPCRQWLEAHADPATTTVYVGIDWTETHRLPAIEAAYRPWAARAPLCEPPYASKDELIAEANAVGLATPRLYELGFPHNNCGGACVRGGQAQWAHLHNVNPERFATEEAHEQQLRAHLGKDVAVLRERIGGVTYPLPLIELRQRITGGAVDTNDWGGCGCFTETDTKTEAASATESPVQPTPPPPAMPAGYRQPWDKPVPLGARGALPVFPAYVFPPWLAEFVTALADETQTPPDLAGCIALAAVSTAAGGRAMVNVRGTWSEPVNIYTVVAMPPGSRKSPVFRALVTPLLAAEKLLQEQIKPQITEARIAQKVAQEAAEKATHKATTARGDSAPTALAEAQSAALAVEHITVPIAPRLVSDDATPETATTLLTEQGGRLAVLSAEGGIFATLAGRYSGTPNLDLFLKGHAGDLLIVDRRDRRERVDNPALTLGLAVQPEIITELAKSPGFRGRGLLGRILYSLPPSNVGYRRIDSPPIPDLVSAAYAANLERLVLTMHGWEDPARLNLSPEAVELFTAQRERTEPRLRPETGDLGHIADWAAKFDGAVARLAGLLHLAGHIDDGWRRPIGGDTMAAAMELGEYFTTHALAAFDAMGTDPDQEAARTLHEWLTRTRSERFTVREAFTALPRSRFRKVADLEPALDLLEQLGWIRREPEPPRLGPGRRPSPRYVVHPDLCHP